jgi:hypothetical protein
VNHIKYLSGDTNNNPYKTLETMTASLNPKLVSSLKKDNFMLPPKHHSDMGDDDNRGVADERFVTQQMQYQNVG